MLFYYLKLEHPTKGHLINALRVGDAGFSGVVMGAEGRQKLRPAGIILII